MNSASRKRLVSEDNPVQAGPKDSIPLMLRLEDLWQRGQRPDVHGFLAQADSISATEMLAVLSVDQWYRWQAGEHPSAEEYLRRYPDLAGESEYALQLAYGEFLVREYMGEEPALAEYQRRFPYLADRLPQRVEQHQESAMGASVTRPNGQATLAFEGSFTSPGGSVAGGSCRY